jgi:acyl carrier protein
VRTIFETSLQVTAEIETQVDTLAIDRLALIFQEILGVEKIGPHDDFFLNGGDSLRTARLIATVEERWGAKLRPTDIFRAGTPYLLSQLLYAPGDPQSEGIPQIQTGTKDTPLIFLHGDLHGIARYMVNFARDFDPDRSVYTLPPHGTSGVPKLGTIEEMAQD